MKSAGSAATCGAAELHARLIEIELMIKNDRTDEAASQAKRLPESWEQIEYQLKNTLGICQM